MNQSLGHLDTEEVTFNFSTSFSCQTNKQIRNRIRLLFRRVLSPCTIEEIVLVAIIFLYTARALYLTYAVCRIRQLKDPTIGLTTAGTNLDRDKDSTTTTRSLKTLVVLGSGGHTTEMLHLIKNLNPDRYGPIILVIAASDETSLNRVKAYPYPLPIKNKKDLVGNNSNSNSSQVFTIPRSREVGQSYSSSILTTAYSFFFAFWLVGFKVQPDLVLVNGPGTCIPIAYSAFFFRIIGWMVQTKIIFIESFCRVKSLSLTGKLLYPIADLFVVCWDQLHQKFPLTHLVTSFIPTTVNKKKRI